MTCHSTTLPNGDHAIICTRDRKPRPCVGCGADATRLCDAPIGRSKRTCSAPLCFGCALSHGPELDFCPDHVPPVGFVARTRVEWSEYFIERAAIAEYAGGLQRGQAERLARELAGPRPPAGGRA